MNANVSAPVAVLPVVKGGDGVWEAVVDAVRGSDDIDVRDDLDDGAGEVAVVRVLGDEKQLRVFVDAEGQGVVRYTDALPDG